MAVTAANTVSPAEVAVGRRAQVTCTLTNGGSEDVEVRFVEPNAAEDDRAPRAAPVNLGRAGTGPGKDVTVPAGGTLTLDWGVVPLASSTTGAYDLGAVIGLSDGTTINATAAELTVA